MTTDGGATLRKDAQRNRDAILDAARQLFAESDEVPMYEIAKRAGVGQATLYRNFPDHGAIVAALFSEQLGRLEELATRHRGDRDAFFILLRSVVDAQVHFHGLSGVLRQHQNEALKPEPLKDRFRALIKRPLRDAKNAGTLRRDLTIEDLFLLVSMVGGALDKSGDAAAQAAAAKRAHALILDGISTSPYKESSRSRRSTSS